MKLFDSNLEILVIRTIIINNDLRSLETCKDWFYTDDGKEIILRVLSLVEHKGSIPSIELLAIDPAISVTSQILLKEKIKIENGMEDALSRLEEYYKARIIIETYKLVSEAMTGNTPDISKVINIMDLGITKVKTRTTSDEMETLVEGMDLDLIEESMQPLDESKIFKTLFDDFDSEWLLKAQQLLVVSAPSGSGKSILMQVLSQNFYRGGANVFEVSFEMSKEELRERRMSSISRIPHKKISNRSLSETEKEHIRKSMVEFAYTGNGNKLTTFSTYKDLDIAGLDLFVKDYDVVLIDYLGLLKTSDKKAQHEAYGELARQAKLMAKKNNQLVVLLTQLDDETLKVKYSKAIKANCDFLWAFQIGETEMESGQVIINQYKVRNGEVKNFTLRHDRNRCYFGNLSDYQGGQGEISSKVIV